MSKREEYRQQLNRLEEAYARGYLHDGNENIYLLRTSQGWQQYEQECDNLKELATEVLIEERKK